MKNGVFFYILLQSSVALLTEKSYTLTLKKQNEIKMNDLFRKYKQQINDYFGKVRHRVRIFNYRGHVIVDIEYEDFRNEEHVSQCIRGIIGNNMYLNLKRECSRSMQAHIIQMYGPMDHIRLHQLIEEYEE